MSKNVLITGGNSGIGLEMARALAAGGDRVIIASSDLDKSQAAADEVKAQNPDAQIEAMALNLADFAAIDSFAQELLQRMPVIDVLILNAGLYTHGLRTLDNGLEAMIGIMHFGHFRLTDKLLDAVKAADQGRIVVTSSVAHKLGKLNKASFKDPSKHSLAFSGYAQAKLANLLFTRELALQLEGSNVVVNAFHPGAVATGIWRELPGPLRAIIMKFLVTSEQGADTAVWLANAPEAAKFNGEYFTKRKIASTSKAGRDMALAKDLWEYTAQRM